MLEELKIMKLNENAVIPSRATDGAAGLDLYACIENDVVINPLETVKIPTGIAIDLCDKNLCGLVFARSGLSVNNGICLANGVGVIDSDYKGEVIVALHNNGSEPYAIKKNQRIAQLLIMPIIYPIIKEVKSISSSKRGCGGFGSTGK